MPGSLQLAAPTQVMPMTLCASFSLALEYPILSLIYNDGTIERSMIIDGVNSPRPARIWHMSRRPTPAETTTFMNFFESMQGGLTPFYFYDPYGVGIGIRIGSNYDPTGSSPTGRATVRFRGDWKHIVNSVSRCTIPDITLVETT